MISVVMPYFRRKEILERNLEKYHKFYKGLEIIVVNDGDGPLNVDAEVINLEPKSEPLNPCVPINVGVRNASNEWVLITGPEIYQASPKIPDMLPHIHEQTWLTAATWGHINHRWHCHTSVNQEKHHCKGLPAEAGFHFFGIINRDFFLSFGGFDEDYRNGRDYDDNDFLCRLDQAGAKFKCLDNIVVDHIQTPKLKWKLKSNKGLFKQKWQDKYDME